MIKIVFLPSEKMVNTEHVLLFHKVKNRWYGYNPMSGSNMMLKPIRARAMHMFLKRHEHYDYDDSSQCQFPTGGMLILSCVSMVKLYIGLDNRFIFTPRHLRLHLNGYKLNALDKLIRSFEFIKIYCKMFLQRF